MGESLLAVLWVMCPGLDCNGWGKGLSKGAFQNSSASVAEGRTILPKLYTVGGGKDQTALRKRNDAMWLKTSEIYYIMSLQRFQKVFF